MKRFSDLSDKLQLLVERDHSIRNVLSERGILNDAYHSELEKVHKENTAKLKVLIKEFGFPVLSSAEEESVRDSWLIVQHSISDPEFIRESLFQMRLAAANQDYPLELLAYTEDRVRFFEGRPQLYGTNFEWMDGEFVMTEVEDPKLLSRRRESMGLPPLSPNKQLSFEAPPKDPIKKQQEFLNWLKKVGWRID